MSQSEVDQFHKAVRYMHRLLSVTGRSEQAVKERLTQRGYSPDIIAKVIADAKKQTIVNDSKQIGEAVQNSKLFKIQGRKKLYFDLKKKGFIEQDIQDALKNFSREEEKEIARKALNSKLEKMRANDKANAKRRAYDFLIRRGFDQEICQQLLNEHRWYDERNYIYENS